MVGWPGRDRVKNHKRRRREKGLKNDRGVFPAMRWARPAVTAGRWRPSVAVKEAYVRALAHGVAPLVLLLRLVWLGGVEATPLGRLFLPLRALVGLLGVML